MEQLRAAADQLTQSYPEVEEVWLFGSLARGDAVPGSDADVLVLLRETSLAFQERAVRYTPHRCGISVDCFSYTESEFLSLRDSIPRFYHTVVRERIPLYRRGSQEANT